MYFCLSINLLLKGLDGICCIQSIGVDLCGFPLCVKPISLPEHTSYKSVAEIHGIHCMQSVGIHLYGSMTPCVNNLYLSQNNHLFDAERIQSECHPQE